MHNVLLLIHGKKFPQIPVDLKTTYPNNFHGLFNQLFQLINHLTFPEYQSWYKTPEIELWIDVMSTDIFEGKTIPISEILDLEMMNREFGYNLKDLANYDPKLNLPFRNFWAFDEPFAAYNKYPETFKQNCRKLRFSKRLLNMARDINSKKGLTDRLVNLVHLRFCSNFNTKLNSFRGTPLEMKTGQYSDFNQEGEIYERTLQECRNTINQNCDKSIPLCLLVPNKNHPFIEELRKDYEVFIVQESEYLEYLDGMTYGNDISGICDVAWASQLRINNFIHQADESSKNISSYSLFLREYLTYRREMKYYNP